MMKIILLFIVLLNTSCMTPAAKPPERSEFIQSKALKALDQKNYETSVIESKGSTIHLYLRKDSVLSAEKIKKAIVKSWPLISDAFLLSSAELALVDSEGPIGGGPIEPYIVTLYSTRSMNTFFKKLVTQATGWAGENSTQDYIKRHYGHFADPEQAYVDDIVIHELAHTVFGFGLTKATEDQKDWWFTFGLGLLYDRMIWDKLYEKKSPLFSSAVDQWQKVFSQIKALDQRLVKPNLQLDEKYNLSRLQVYGHGKSLSYLTELRNELGSKEFNAAVLDLIKNGGVLDYDLFLQTYFKDKKKLILNLEAKFQVR